MNTVLVTGASGFIGRFLILALLKKGDTVFALLRKPQEQLVEIQTWLKQYGVTESQNLYAVQGDLAQSDLGISANGWQAMQSVQVVYNCGGLFHWGMQVEHARAVNVQGAVRLVELTAQHLKINQFIHVSGFTLAIRDHMNELGINTDLDGTQMNWTSVYQKAGAYEGSKLEAHFAVKRTAQALNIPLSIVLPSGVIGHSQTGEISTSQDIAKTIIKLLQRKLPIVPKGYLFMVSVDELTHFMAHIADFPESIGQEYVLSSANPLNLKAALSICAESAHVPAPFLSIPVPMLKLIAKIPPLARFLELELEMLNFIRTEPLDITATIEMQRKMGLVGTTLMDSLKNSTRFLSR
jgi:dihydroflavonol-4-reductase